MTQEKFFEILQYAAAAADKSGAFHRSVKKNIYKMLRTFRAATGATINPAPKNDDELEAILLCGHGVGLSRSRDKWLDHVLNGGLFSLYPDISAIRETYTANIDFDNWADFEACHLANACAEICDLAARHRLFNLAEASSPDAIAKSGTVASRHPDSSRGSLVLTVDGSRHVCKLSGCTGDKKRHYNFEGWSAPGKFSNLEIAEKREALAFLAKHGKKISLIIH